MNDKKTNNKYTLTFKHKTIACISYIYIILPIVIFFLGWLRLYLAIPASILLGVGLYFIISKEYDDRDCFKIDWRGALISFLMLLIWVYSSGIGGFFPQQADWHWRNAILRDLIDYSWPVIYPKTGNALVYYFNFFLPAALVGKMVGMYAANVFLFVFTLFGVILSYLLICKLLKIETVKQLILLALIFIIWGGLESQRSVLYDILNLNGTAAYQFSPNNVLLQWVTNQTIVPWIAMPLFLNKKRVRTYIYIGMCLLASAPLPFVGFFVFLVSDGISQLYKNFKWKIVHWLKEIFSIPNICALLSIFPVYAFFFLCNTATSGSSGVGGFGLYVPIEQFTFRQALNLFTFLLFNFGIYALLIYKENKKSLLYWCMCISLILIPFFRVGEGWDFGIRACIPAQFFLMIIVINYIINSENITYQKLAFIWIMALISLPIYTEFFSRLTEKNNANGRQEIMADLVHTLANKSNDGYYVGSSLRMYLTENPENTMFFSKLAKTKKNTSIQHDTNITDTYMQEHGFIVPSGRYSISLKKDENVQIGIRDNYVVATNEGSRISISDSSIDGKYEIYLHDSNQIWSYSAEDNYVELLFEADGRIWSVLDVPEAKLFNLEEFNGSYIISWSNDFALTYLNGELVWCPKDYSSEQLWILQTL